MKLRKSRAKFIRFIDPAETIIAREDGSFYAVWIRGMWYRLDRGAREWIAIEHDEARSLTTMPFDTLTEIEIGG